MSRNRAFRALMRMFWPALAACGSAPSPVIVNRPPPPVAELRCPAGDALAALAKRTWTSLLRDREATEVHCTELSRRGKPYLWLTAVESPGEFGPTIVRALIAPDGKPVHTDMDRDSSYDVRHVPKDLDGDGEDELVRAVTFAYDGSKTLEVIAPREGKVPGPGAGMDDVMGTFVSGRARLDNCDLSLAYVRVGRALDIAVQCDARRVWHWTGSNLVEVK